MKRLLLTIAILVSISATSQVPPDSVKVTLPVQVRDIEFISAVHYQSFGFEELLDSIKVKMRVSNPPTGNTSVNITGYVCDWLFIYCDISSNVVALTSNCATRMKSLLSALNNTTINSKIQAIDDYQSNQFTDSRRSGRNRLRRQNNNIQL